MKLLTDKYFKGYKEKNKNNIFKFFEKAGVNGNGNNFDFYFDISAVYSSNIEGNPMDLNSYLNAKAFKNKIKTKDYKEIEDLKNTYAFAKGNKLTEKNFIEAHKFLSKQFLIKSKRGVYRSERIGIFGEEGLIYAAIEPEKVEIEMKRLLADIYTLLNKKGFSKEKVFYFASMIHLRLAQIHPFADGNGRIARLLEKWILSMFIGEKTWIIKSEKYYKENRSYYYKHINLGVNYYEVNMDKCIPFLGMLAKAAAL
ncbi:MAG TPA: Fic family protein [Ignavibacteria bacterium]